FHDSSHSSMSTLSLHDALPILLDEVEEGIEKIEGIVTVECIQDLVEDALLNNHHTSVAKAYIQYRERQRQKRQRDLFEKRTAMKDRKSTRLNSSHVSISYAVFC